MFINILNCFGFSFEEFKNISKNSSIFLELFFQNISQSQILLSSSNVVESVQFQFQVAVLLNQLIYSYMFPLKSSIEIIAELIEIFQIISCLYNSSLYLTIAGSLIFVLSYLAGTIYHSSQVGHHHAIAIELIRNVDNNTNNIAKIFIFFINNKNKLFRYLKNT